MSSLILPTTPRRRFLEFGGAALGAAALMSGAATAAPGKKSEPSGHDAKLMMVRQDHITHLAHRPFISKPGLSDPDCGRRRPEVEKVAGTDQTVADL